MTETKNEAPLSSGIPSRDPGRCTCGRDPFAGLPPEAVPKPGERKSDLRQATCPACGMSYWTNRDTDLCIECTGKPHRGA